MTKNKLKALKLRKLQAKRVRKSLKRQQKLASREIFLAKKMNKFIKRLVLKMQMMKNMSAETLTATKNVVEDFKNELP